MSISRPSSRTDSEPPPLKRPRLDNDALPNNPLKRKLRPREPRDTVQISTWNVAGLYSCNAEKWKFGFRLYVEAENPHVLAITEVSFTPTYVNEKDAANVFEKDDNFAFLRERYPVSPLPLSHHVSRLTSSSRRKYRYWSPKVAVLSKFKPIAPPLYGFPEGTKCDREVEAESRAITLEFKEIFLLATYVPNSGANFQSLDRRKKWNADFEPHIQACDMDRFALPLFPLPSLSLALLLTLFIARKHGTSTSSVPTRPPPPPNWRRLAGTHEDEINAHERLLGVQEELRYPRRPGRRFVDVWRLINGEGRREYTFIVSERLLYRVRKCKIRYAVKEEFFPAPDIVRLGALSDHWPVWLSLEMERADFEDDGEEALRGSA
ncbi:SPOSA6832_03383, partial [Sporobolomyces salmonicolor]